MNMQTWIRKNDEPAHLVRIFGFAYFTAACGEIIARNAAVKVRMKRIGLNYFPYHQYRPDAAQVCPTCQRKAG